MSNADDFEFLFGHFEQSMVQPAAMAAFSPRVLAALSVLLLTSCSSPSLWPKTTPLWGTSRQAGGTPVPPESAVNTDVSSAAARAGMMSSTTPEDGPPSIGSTNRTGVQAASWPRSQPASGRFASSETGAPQTANRDAAVSGYPSTGVRRLGEGVASPEWPQGGSPTGGFAPSASAPSAPPFSDRMSAAGPGASPLAHSATASENRAASLLAGPAGVTQLLDTQLLNRPPISSSDLGTLLKIDDSTVTVATVGDQYILKGELQGNANVMLAPYIEQLAPDALASKRKQILEDRDRLTQQLLQQAIERKLMYLEFIRTIPPDKLKEALDSIQQKVNESFTKELEEMLTRLRKTDPKGYEKLSRQDPQLFRLAFLMKEKNLETPLQLEEFLRRYGSSLDAQRVIYAETALGRQAIGSQIDRNPEITHEELLTYYQERASEFEVPSRAKWEQLTARFDHHNSRDACYQAIVAMGNEVYLGGAPLSAVAKRSSNSACASKGGYHDWTEWGDLTISRELLTQVFTLPPGELSPIISDAEGLHIVRVIEQQAAHQRSFREAQSEIRETLQAEQRNEQVQRIIARLRKQTPVWTIDDR